MIRPDTFRPGRTTCLYKPSLKYWEACTPSTSSATRSGGGSWNCSPTANCRPAVSRARSASEFGISQPAVSQHLRVLRDNGFATVTVDGTRRLYAVDTGPLQEIDAWLDRYRKFWTNRLDALDTELRRGRRAARKESGDA